MAISASQVIYSNGLLIMQRDERYWTDPKEFKPERWLDGREPFHKYAYEPFGLGNIMGKIRVIV
jgi:cytochrome P450